MTMKAKLLMMAAFGAAMAFMASCSDDPKTDYVEDNFEIRQIRLSAVNPEYSSGTSVVCSAVSSETAGERTATAALPAFDMDGKPVIDPESNEQVWLRANVAEIGSDCLIAADGQDINLSFEPGFVVNNITVTYPDGNTKVLTAEDTEATYNVGEFPDSALISAKQVVEMNGSVYNYTGKIYLVHYQLKLSDKEIEDLFKEEE